MSGGLISTSDANTLAIRRGRAAGPGRRSGVVTSLLVIVALAISIATPAAADDGDLDAGFSDAGVYRLDLGDDESLTGVFTGADGALYTVGRSGDAPIVVSLLADGTPNLDYSMDGVVVVNSGGAFEYEAATMDNLGRVLILGRLAGGMAVLRLTTDGEVDMTFSDDGLAELPVDQTQVYDVDVDAAGRVITVGNAAGVTQVSRLTDDGDLDYSFGSSGTVAVSDLTDTDDAYGAVMADGGIALAITSFDGATSSIQVRRVTESGQVDGGFAQATVATPLDSIAEDITVAPTGRIVVVGITVSMPSDAHPIVGRFLTSGALDQSFGRTGVVTIPSEDSYLGLEIGVDSMNRILVAGFIQRSSSSDTAAVSRLLANGTVDPSFGADGTALADIGEGFERFASLLVQDDAGIVAVGSAQGLVDRNLLVVRFEGSMPAVAFTDDDGSVFEGDIEALGRAGITLGCNPPANDEYCPDANVTRGQMAAFLVRGIGYTDAGAGDLFTDDDNSVFESDIDKLGTAGVTLGCNPPANDEYCPDQPVTRGQMAAFLVRALGLG
jgi:uncharacterized delta-60 repeat protein